jgi:chromosome segregation ATPase
MTNTSNDDIRGILAQIAQSQLTTQQQLEGTQQQLANLAERQEISGQQIVQLTDVVNQLTSDISSVTARNAVLNDIIPELRESQERQELLTTELKQNFEQHQRNFDRHQDSFEKHQRTTNGALQSLEAILLQLIRNGGNA